MFVRILLPIDIFVFKYDRQVTEEENTTKNGILTHLSTIVPATLMPAVVIWWVNSQT